MGDGRKTLVEKSCRVGTAHHLGLGYFYLISSNAKKIEGYC
jgi:hypothetical protein